MNNCTIVLFGATGDLAKRKIIPAMYRLVLDKQLDTFNIIGAALDDTSIESVLEPAKEFIKEFDKKAWQKFVDNAYYQKLNFTKEANFKKLNTLVTDLEKQKKIAGNRLFYCAAASEFFCAITEHLASSGLARRLDKKDTTWNRIVYEKPFGHDLASAHEVNECIAKYFNEEQIYRIDHYLSKELVANIALMRFTNIVFEPLWNNRFIDNVQIELNEDFGIGERGAYYDKYGALKDVVQNHMLELVALIAMETPKLLTGEYIRDKRTDVLKHVRITDVLLGQYDGYKKEKYVDPISNTDTFVAAQVFVDTPRWIGVPFYLKTGKRLKAKETFINIKFKKVDCLLLKDCPTDSNYLTFKIAPKAIFQLEINAKKHGVPNQVMPIKMEFCHSCIGGVRSPHAYETLIDEVMKGGQSISVRFDEIEYAWKAIDAAQKVLSPVYPYKPGVNGPTELKDFEQKHGMRWKK